MSRQSRIERLFNDVDNKHSEDSPIPEVIRLLREMFDYLKEIDQRITDSTEANRKDV